MHVSPVVTIALIQRITCEQFGLSLNELRGHRRARQFARPRQMAMSLAMELTRCSLPAIGRQFGGRDHTTVLHARQKVDQLCHEDGAFAHRYVGLRAAILAEIPTADGGAVVLASHMAEALAAGFTRALNDLVRRDPLQALAAMRPLAKTLGVEL